MKKYARNKLYILLSVMALVTGCSVLSKSDKKSGYPKSPEDTRRDRNGSLTGNGLVLFGKSDDSDSSGGNSGIGINSYLWRATLETLSFMPMASADPFGGVIITDWYEDPKSKGERFKVNVVIVDKKLTANAVNVSVFKQVYTGGSWRDSVPSDTVAIDLENKILTKARVLRVEKESSKK
jgi:hypothetical protein